VLKQGVNLTHLAVLFRADGDVSEVDGIQIPGRLARLDEGKEYAYLIDCMDTFNDRAMRRSKSRQKQYQDQKWTEITKEELLNDLSRISKADSD
jgi:superfamily II DNA or RNA helicase